LFWQREGWADLLEGEGGEPLAHIDGGVEALALDEAGEEATGKGVTGAVGVLDLVLGQLTDWVLLGGGGALGDVADDGDGLVGALGEDDGSWSRSVLLWQQGDLLCDLLNVGGAQVVGLGVGEGLGLVANQVVPVWGVGVQWLLEDGWKEWGAEVHGVDLVVGGSVLTKGVHGLWADGQVEATDVEHLGGLNVLPVLRGTEMGGLVMVGGTEVSSKGSVLAGDERSALAGGHILLNHVIGVNARGVVGLSKLVGEFVVADGAVVDDRVLWQDVLRTSGTVLSSTTSQNMDIVHLDDLVEDGHVLLLNQNGVISLQVVFLEVILSHLGLKIQKWVSENKQIVWHCSSTLYYSFFKKNVVILLPRHHPFYSSSNTAPLPQQRPSTAPSTTHQPCMHVHHFPNNPYQFAAQDYY
jgi:hypothetical protein